MIELEVAKLLEKEDFLALYNEGMSLLYRSGIFETLKRLGQPKLVFDGKDVNAMAAQAARTIGWNGCLNTLFDFQTIVMNAVASKGGTSTKAFDALDVAVRRGDLLELEAEAIRNGKRIDPTIYKPKPIPNSGNAVSNGGSSS